MKKILTTIIFALLCSAQIFAISNSQDQFHTTIKLEITNNLNIERIDELVSVDLDNLFDVYKNFNIDGFIVYQSGIEIPSQVFNSEEENYILFVSNFEPNETKDFEIKYLDGVTLRKNYKSRTYAELAMKFDAIYKDKKFTSDHFHNYTKVLVPQIHTDHDALFKYEGPGWESEKVGYRFYLDWRNATDIFGKKVNELVLSKVGVNDVVAKDDSYHEMQDWGMDIFKVGSSLGIGSIGMMNADSIYMVSKTDQVKCEIPSNGPILSEIITDYKGWEVGENKYNLTSKLSISAGSRITNVNLQICKKAKNITTGIAKHSDTEFLKSSTEGKWQYIALYGKQTLADDNVGIVLFYDKTKLIKQGEDNLNYFIELSPSEGNVEYKFAAAWEQEPDGIKNKNEFMKYLNEEQLKINSELTIEIE